MRRRFAAVVLTAVTAAFLTLSLGTGSASASIDIDQTQSSFLAIN